MGRFYQIRPVMGWTDYPFLALGDDAYQLAPIRQVLVMEYDGDKYAKVRVFGTEYITEIKAGYIYEREGRDGQVPPLKLERPWGYVPPSTQAPVPPPPPMVERVQPEPQAPVAMFIPLSAPPSRPIPPPVQRIKLKRMGEDRVTDLLPDTEVFESIVLTDKKRQLKTFGAGDLVYTKGDPGYGESRELLYLWEVVG